ncbi:oligosaccharide flippase family protein [Rufibacter psychrotolerans]|uniref:oligosaccharide flippase family protein n=1 Tax=Rufibacter psychrotolerans TaxID=2812556 RepID=UPI0019672D50|nr:oligosaccharide flippase family protein [Rufibacter sp. SYSU D00308]
MAQKQHVRQFLGNSVWSGLSTVARAGSSLLINKLFAVYYGPLGITLLAHFQNLVALLTTLPNSGINVGLIRHLAQHEPESPEYRSFFWAGLLLNAATFVGVVGTVALFPDFFLERFGEQLLGQESQGSLWAVVGLFVLLLLQLFWLAVLLARQALRPYVWLGLLTSITSVAVTWWAVGRVELTTALVLFLTGQSFTGLVGLAVVFSKGLVPAWQLRFPTSVLQDLGKFLVMALSTLVGAKLVDFVVREMAIQHFSLVETGLWQAVAKISDSYTMVYISILGMVYYPKIAALLPQPQALREYVRTVFFLLVPTIAVGLLTFGWLRDFFIQLLFHRDFLAARELMDYQLLGDFLKMTAWVLSYIVTVQARVKLYIFTQLASGIVYVALVAWLMPLLGVEGLPLAHALRYAVYLLFHLYLFRSYFSAT